MLAAQITVMYGIVERICIQTHFPSVEQINTWTTGELLCYMLCTEQVGMSQLPTSVSVATWGHHDEITFPSYNNHEWLLDNQAEATATQQQRRCATFDLRNVINVTTALQRLTLARCTLSSNTQSIYVPDIITMIADNIKFDIDEWSDIWEQTCSPGLMECPFGKCLLT